MSDPSITANIGSLDALPGGAFLDTDVLEVERVRPDPEPNDNYHATWGNLMAAITAAIGSGAQTGDTLVSARNPGAGWLAQGSIYAQSAYPAAFALLGAIPDGPPGAVWEDVAGGTGRAVNAYGQLPDGDVIIGVGANVVWRSLDRARAWESITTSITLTVIDVLPSGAYAAGTGTNAPFVRSTDDGATWVAMTKPTGVSTTIAPLGFRQSGTRLFVFYATAGGVYYSDNNGASWTQATGLGSTAPQQLVAHGASTLSVLTSNSTATFRSTDNGASWSASAALPANGPTAAGRYYVSESAPMTIVAGNGGVLRTTDRGASWIVVLAVSGFGAVIAVSGRIIAVGSPGFRYSDDNGGVWISASTTVNVNVSRMYVGAAEVVLQPTGAAANYTRSPFAYSYDRLTQFKVPLNSGVAAGFKGWMKA